MQNRLVVLSAALILFYSATLSATEIEVNAQIPTATTTQKSKITALPKNKVVSQSHAQAASAQYDYWFHETWLTLTRDRDNDGYASAFSLTIDIDTVFDKSEVYAVVYLGNDSHYSSLYETSVFEIYGNSSNDALTLDIDLLTGYPARDYDVLVEIYDAYTSELLTYNNLYDDADLGYQPMESRNFDTAVYAQSVVVEHHGGSFSFPLIALLVAPLLLFRYRRCFSSSSAL